MLIGKVIGDFFEAKTACIQLKNFPDNGGGGLIN